MHLHTIKKIQSLIRRAASLLVLISDWFSWSVFPPCIFQDLLTVVSRTAPVPVSRVQKMPPPPGRTGSAALRLGTIRRGDLVEEEGMVESVKSKMAHRWHG